MIEKQNSFLTGKTRLKQISASSDNQIKTMRTSFLLNRPGMAESNAKSLFKQAVQPQENTFASANNEGPPTPEYSDELNEYYDLFDDTCKQTDEATPNAADQDDKPIEPPSSSDQAGKSVQLRALTQFKVNLQKPNSKKFLLDFKPSPKRLELMDSPGRQLQLKSAAEPPSSLKEVLLEATRQVEALDSIGKQKIFELEQKNRELSEQLSSLEKTLDDQQDLIKQTSQEMQNSMKKALENDARIEELILFNTKYKEKTREIQLECDNLKKQFDLLSVELYQKQNECDRMSQVANDFKSRCAEQESRCIFIITIDEGLQKSIELQVSELSKIIQSMQDQMEESSKEFIRKQLEHEKKEMAHEAAITEMRIDHEKEITRLERDQKQRIQEYLEEKQELKEANSKLSNQIQVFLREKETLNDSLNDLKPRIIELENQKQLMQMEYENLNENFIKTTSELQVVSAEFKSKTSEYSESVNQFNKEKSQLLKEIRNLEIAKEKSESGREIQNEKTSSLEQQLIFKQLEFADYKSISEQKMAELNEKINELETTNKKIVQEFKQEYATKNFELEKKQLIEKMNAQKQQEIDELKANFNSFIAREKADQSNLIHQLRQQIDSMNASASCKGITRQKTINALESDPEDSPVFKKSKVVTNNKKPKGSLANLPLKSKRFSKFTKSSDIFDENDIFDKSY